MNPNPVSPKVVVAAVIGVLLTAVVSNAAAVTPDMLNFLGPWKLFVLGTALTALTTAAGYYKADPLRVPLDVPRAQVPARQDTPAPVQPAPAPATSQAASLDPFPGLPALPGDTVKP